MGTITRKISHLSTHYKYALLILAAGILLMNIPTTEIQNNQTDIQPEDGPSSNSVCEKRMELILSNIQGAGTVQVMLTVGEGSKTIFQENTDITGNTTGSRTTTVTVTDASRNQHGLIQQTLPENYRGAVIICQGADSPEVKYNITQAVSKLTGLGTNRICVLKMK